ncbi:hypothetical protein Pint_35757 [Pistacia integerrima]|uniref:Uncharacterized protein n=1 Tax=Pistacia integerrima TaxID=434235 RepID=A0ACC0Y2M7_9ROSI|nr:hypothetical protein Pint_35757 [Pistacia integerrima]
MSGKVFLANLFLLLLLVSGGQSDIILHINNECTFTLWLGANPSMGDFNSENGPGTLEIFSLSEPWSGSIWARTKCGMNASNLFSCETGDCSSGEIVCQGLQPKYPVTLLNLSVSQSVVSYEVSLNHGFNIPIRIQPIGGSLVDGSGPCPVVDCIQDLGNVCPAELVAKNQNGAYVGCYSACDSLKDPKFCCTGSFTGQACQPNDYSQRFKQLCNLAHTYPTDNDPPTYRCSGAAIYEITFCVF